MKYHFYGGHKAGRLFALAGLCKFYPRMCVVVPNLQALDRMILLGIKPSQLKMSSEFNNASSIHWCSVGMTQDRLSGLYFDWIITDEHPTEEE